MSGPVAMLMDRKDFVPFAFGKDHCECVAWGPDGHIYAGGEAGQVYRVDLDGGSTEIFANIGVDALGLCLDADANVYACSENGHAVFRVTRQGEVSIYSSGSPERPMKIPNYPAFDRQGNLYVSDSSDWEGGNGCIYCIAPGGATTVVTESNLRFPNGLALDPESTELYFIESNMPGVSKARILPHGQLGTPEPVVELPFIVPDGLAFDVERNLYISCYVPHRVYRLSARNPLATIGDYRQLDVMFDDWQGNLLNTPTNMAFAGEDLRTMVFGNLGGTWLTRTAMPVAGIPLPYPKL